MKTIDSQNSPSTFTPRIGIIDDDPAVTLFLSQFLQKKHFAVQTFEDAESFLSRPQFLNDVSNNVSKAEVTSPSPGSSPGRVVKLPERNVFDLVLVDVNLPGMSGLELLKRLRVKQSDQPVILISAKTSTKEAVQGIKSGAYDYIEKPFDVHRLEVIIRNALKLTIAQQKVKSMTAPIQMEGVHCVSASMWQVYDLIRRASATSSNVLISGESGVGKELVAKAVHENSPRAKKPFVGINCSAIPEHLLESELFGHSKGSFTGAHQDRAGLFVEANGGTLFLDEIGDLDPVMQVKLLRAVQDRKIRAVGSNREISVDVRLVSATNKNLNQAVADGSFREDLFYRLNVIPIFVPPLRQRKEDILVLADFFLRMYEKKFNLSPKSFSGAALEKLLKMPFQGNVRELQNLVERCAVFSEGSEIGELEIPSSTETDVMYSSLTEEMPVLKELESRYVKSILDKYQGDKQAAAKALGVSKRTLYRRLEEIEKSNQPILQGRNHS